MTTLNNSFIARVTNEIFSKILIVFYITVNMSNYFSILILIMRCLHPITNIEYTFMIRLKITGFLKFKISYDKLAEIVTLDHSSQNFNN